VTTWLKPVAPVNFALLFLCASMYLGTGWSLALFSFPIASRLTISTYYLEFVPQVQAATHFFTYMTSLMLLCTIIMARIEWRTPERWVPVTVLAAIVLATALTMTVIFPLNQAMAAGITDDRLLRSVLSRWMTLNWVRVALWTVEWASLMAFVLIRAYRRGAS
jgi:hypothetical protein